MKLSRKSILSKVKNLENSLQNTELSNQEEFILEKNLIWIFASRRSGTTWLASELLSYQTLFLDEPLLGMHLGRIEQTSSGPKRIIDIQKDRKDYFFSLKYEKTWKKFLRKLILNRIFAQFKDLEHKIIIKEPNGSYSSDIFSNVTPKSKIIVLLRDGRDTLDSSLDALKKGGWENKRGHEELTSEKRMEYIKRYSKNWNLLTDILMITYNSHDKNRRLLIKYEDLLKNTNNLLPKIYQFCDIEIKQNVLDEKIEKFKFENISEDEKGEGKFRRSATPGKWKENFNEDEKSVMEEIMGESLRKLGY